VGSFMAYSTKPIQANIYDLQNELSSTILNYLLQDQIVLLDDEAVPENYLEVLFEDVRNQLYELVKHKEINNVRYHHALGALLTKSSFEGIKQSPTKPAIIIRIRMLASIEKF
jgi:hypothetical protein